LGLKQYLGAHGCLRALNKRGSSVLRCSARHWVQGKFFDSLDGQIDGFPERAHDQLWVDSIFDEALHRCHEFTCEEGDRSGSVADLGVLGFSDVDESLCSWMDDVEELENRRSVVGNMSLKRVRS